MKLTSKRAAVRVAIVGVVAAALVGGTFSAANAATTPPATTGSKGALYLADPNTDTVIPADTQLAFTDDVIAQFKANDPTVGFPKETGSTNASTFLAPRGQEANPSAWITQTTNVQQAGNPVVFSPTLTLSAFENGPTPGATIKLNGGSYSLGIAFTSNNGLTVVGTPYFTFVNIDPSTGAWKFDSPTTVTPPDPCIANPSGPGCPVQPTDCNFSNQAAPTASSGQVGLCATVITGVDGNLTLNVPAGARANLGSAALVAGQSTSTGTLPAFTVNDGRVVSRPGWTINADVNDFTKIGTAAFTIPKKQLGLAPKWTAGDPGVVVGPTQVAGTATYPTKFASAPAGSGLGTYTFGGDLKLVAPGNAPAGTYQSVMTLTLVSGS